jgi:L-aminopeptidase/D-esterase-like protein
MAKRGRPPKKRLETEGNGIPLHVESKPELLVLACNVLGSLESAQLKRVARGLAIGLADTLSGSELNRLFELSRS